jgi:hypothetical protein
MPSVNLKKYIIYKFIICILLPQHLAADLNKVEIEMILDNDSNYNHICNFDKYLTSHYPESPSLIYKKIKQSSLEDSDCKKHKDILLLSIEDEYLGHKKTIGINLNSADINFANTSLKFLNSNSIYFSSQGSRKNLSYNFSVSSKGENATFNNSYIKFYKNNKIFSLGKVSQWWGPSDEISLILSNQADPLPLISLENNIPFRLTNLGSVYYKFFFSKLENDRHIPNAKLIGARIELNRNNNLIIGISRTAQFGGDGRPENFSTLKNIILGRDNTGTAGFDEPGNQLAALDLKYVSDNQIEYFFQIAGEDESGYLPSRTFYDVGFKTNLLKGRFTFDYANTMSSSGIKNYTYNHFLYKDGYRYNGQPLGASIDADSNIAIAAYKTISDKNTFYSIKLLSGKLNFNNNKRNYLSTKSTKINGLSLELIKKHKVYKIKLKYGYFDTKVDLSKNNISLGIEYSF